MTQEEQLYNIEIEERLLSPFLSAAISFDDPDIKQFLHLFKKEIFAHEANKCIASIMIELQEQGKSFDIVTLTSYATKTNRLKLCGGAYYITILSGRYKNNAFEAFQMIPQYLMILNELMMRRELVKIRTFIEDNVLDKSKDIFEIIEAFKTQINDLEHGLKNKRLRSTVDIGKAVIQDMRNMQSLGKTINGFSTGLHALDEILMGIRKKFIYVIGGRPGMGKSGLMKSITRQLAFKQNVKVGIFSLEMTSEQLVTQLLSEMSEINNKLLQTGKLNESQFAQLETIVSTKLNNNLIIDDTSGITIQYIRRKIREWKQTGLEVVFIDYIQLIQLSKADRQGKSREQEMSYICDNLAIIAKEEDVAIVEISQLGREVEKRSIAANASHRPLLSDLKESGSIEANAQVVLFPYRPEYYKVYQNADGKDTRGLAEIIVAKNRFGETTSCLVKFIGFLTMFDNLDEVAQNNDVPEIFTSTGDDPDSF